jgi:uncharacterized protein (DUF697 family)
MGSTIALVEPVPGLDIPLLIGVQLRMMLRLAAIYGEKISVKRARELVSAIAGSYGLRYLAQFVAKFIPLAGWLVSAVVWGTGTLTLGSVAMVFFDNRGNLSPAQLRSLYRRIRWKRKGQEQLESLNGS